MQVKNGLVGAGAVIHHGSKAVLAESLTTGDLTGGLEEWLLVNICGLVASIRESFAWLNGGACRLATAPMA